MEMEIADDKLNIAQMSRFVFNRVQNTVGKRENAGNHYCI